MRQMHVNLRNMRRNISYHQWPCRLVSIDTVRQTTPQTTMHGVHSTKCINICNYTCTTASTNNMWMAWWWCTCDGCLHIHTSTLQSIPSIPIDNQLPLNLPPLQHRFPVLQHLLHRRLNICHRRHMRKHSNTRMGPQGTGCRQRFSLKHI